MTKIKDSPWITWVTIIAFINEILRMIFGRNNNE
tara:strand:- start:487 stop:588 length:102 start_codon:yes stop_codon:yes gene_type:complete